MLPADALLAGAPPTAMVTPTTDAVTAANRAWFLSMKNPLTLVWQRPIRWCSSCPRPVLLIGFVALKANPFRQWRKQRTYATELRATDPQQRAMLTTYLDDLALPDGTRIVEIGCG